MQLHNLDHHTIAGWKTRQERAEAKHIRNTDPIRHSIAAMRAANSYDCRAEAEAEYAKAHALVASPVPARVSQDVAALLKKFLAEHGLSDADLTAPINPHETVAEIETRIRAEMARQYAEASAALAFHEREAALAAVAQAQAALAEVDEQHRSRGVTVPMAPVETLVPAVGGEPRRSRGRPRALDVPAGLLGGPHDE